jgi:hypothetical protein
MAHGLVINEKLLQRRNIQTLIDFQINNIQNEFYQLLTELSPEGQGKSQLLNSFSKLKPSILQFNRNCQNHRDDYCQNISSTLVKNLANLHQQVLLKLTDLNLNKKKVKFTSLGSIESFLFLEKNLFLTESVIRGYYLRSIMEFEVGELTKPKIQNQLKTVQRLFIDASSGLTPKFARREIRNFWQHFLIPLNYIVTGNKDYDYFVSQLAQHNIHLNQFIFHFEKNKKQLSKKSRSLLSTIHRRWNNILRNILQN